MVTIIFLAEGKPLCTETDPQEEKCLDATSDLNSGPPKRKVFEL